MILPEIKYDNYGEIIYDKNKFNVKFVENLIIGDIVIIFNNIGKIISKKSSHASKYGHDKIYIKCIGVFDDNLYEDIIPCNHSIFLPIIKYKLFDFLTKSKYQIELYDENTNEIIEINISSVNIDDHIIKNINNDTVTKIKVVQFDKLNRIVEIL